MDAEFIQQVDIRGEYPLLTVQRDKTLPFNRGIDAGPGLLKQTGCGSRRLTVPASISDQVNWTFFSDNAEIVSLTAFRTCSSAISPEDAPPDRSVHVYRYVQPATAPGTSTRACACLM